MNIIKVCHFPTLMTIQIMHRTVLLPILNY